MGYYQLTYEQLLEEIISIRNSNLTTLDVNAELFESVVEQTRGTSVEYFVPIFDDHRHFFKQVEIVLDDLMLHLEQQEITLGLIERMSKLGVDASNIVFPFRENIDKEAMNSIPEFIAPLNKWYALIGNNLNAITELEIIADVLNANFRHVIPLREVESDNIAKQSEDGVTITKTDDIYLDENEVRLAGQRKKILLLLAENYISNPNMTVSWREIEPEIRTDNILTRENTVNRVSSLRTRLEEMGYDSVVEISCAGEGDEVSWRLIKH